MTRHQKNIIISHLMGSAIVLACLWVLAWFFFFTQHEVQFFAFCWPVDGGDMCEFNLMSK